MIIPLSHEDQRGRRWPYITISILLLNILIFAFSHASMQEQHEQYDSKLQQALEFYMSHPWVKAPPELEKIVAEYKTNRKDKIFMESVQALNQDAVDARGGVDEETKAADQAEMDKMASEMRQAEKASPLKNYAYTPATNNLLGLFTSQFLHGGWLHLIFNMWFLYLAGCNIEDRYGRVWYPIFYLSAGAVAALAHKAAAPSSMVPLIGASGAIAGAMGAFLIKFGKTRITFLWIYAFMRTKVFSAPAVLMLPLWLASQIFYGLVYGGGEGGVAWWAHVGGFAYGMLFAVVFQKSGLEAKVDSAIEGQVSLHQAPEIVEAGQLMDNGRAPEAIEMLEKFAQSNPSNVDAQLELLRASKITMDQNREKRAYTRLIALYMQQDAPDTALDLYEEVRQTGLVMAVPPALRLRLARQLEKNNMIERATVEYAGIHANRAADVSGFQAALAHANLTLRLKQKKEAVRLFTLAQASPVPHLDMDSNIAHGLKQAESLPDVPGQAAGA